MAEGRSVIFPEWFRWVLIGYAVVLVIVTLVLLATWVLDEVSGWRDHKF